MGADQDEKRRREFLFQKESSMRYFRPVLFLVLLSFPGLVWAGAQGNPPAPSFGPFWRQFSTAVSQNNKEAVASLTHFPLNEMNRSTFLKNYESLFPSQAKLCFQKVKPHEDSGLFNVFCGGNAYLFHEEDGGYKLFSVESRD